LYQKKQSVNRKQTHLWLFPTPIDHVKSLKYGPHYSQKTTIISVNFNRHRQHPTKTRKNEISHLDHDGYRLMQISRIYKTLLGNTSSIRLQSNSSIQPLQISFKS
jgi:hypothetical protein